MTKVAGQDDDAIDGAARTHSRTCIAHPGVGENPVEVEIGKGLRHEPRKYTRDRPPMLRRRKMQAFAWGIAGKLLSDFCGKADVPCVIGSCGT